MGGAVGTNDAGTVHHEGHGQVLNAHVVDELVVRPLQEGAVDGAHRPQAFTSHTGGHGDGVLLGNAHIKILMGASLLEQIQACTRCHRRSDAHHPRILLTQLDQCLPEHLAVAGWFRLAGRVCLAGGEVEGTLGVIAHLIFLGEGIALALGGGHMHEHRPLVGVGLLEHLDHAGDVVAIHRTHVGEAQLLEHRTQLGHGQALHALFEVLQLGGQFTVQEGQVLDRLLGVVLQELQRLAVPHAVQVRAQRANRGADRHVVVVEHHQQAGFG